MTGHGARSGAQRVRRVLLLTCAAALTCGPAAPALAATPTGTHDLVVVGAGTNADDGSPDSQGYVDVRFPDGDTQRLTAAGLGLPPAPAGSDGFGASVAIGDVNADGLSDLVIGANGYYGDHTAGRAWLVLGGANGFTAAGVRDLNVTHGSPAEGFRTYGSAVAISVLNDTVSDIWVADPSATVGGHAMAGRVYRFTFTGPGDGSGTGTLSAATALDQDTAGVPGTAEAGDLFGAALASSSAGVVVGSPGEAIGTQKNAGSVYAVTTDGDNGVVTGASAFSQDTKGVPGSAEAGDLFGASIAPGGQAVGAPGEDVGKLKDAGSVQLFRSSGVPGQLRPDRSVTQDSKGVPGTAEAGDRFGAVVTAGTFTCQEQSQIAVSAPGEGIGKAARAGSVTLVPGAVANSECKSVALSQGSGLPGTAETGEATGSTLAVANGDPEAEEDRYDALLVGVPAESIGTLSQSGRVLLVRFPSRTATSLGPLTGGDQPGAFYGHILGLDAQ
ncbi:FG-GAP repeat protein [Spongisporangium articulatum]|uniref:FG-GAP repeat protein n=1 Tax=Spongisporangium articulatum TaxID=3362603 RepID=A0ABW8ARC2_9ACTN